MQKLILGGSGSKIIIDLIKFIIMFLVFLDTPGFVAAGQKSSSEYSDLFYQISPVYQFKKGIVSITFDDGYIKQFTEGMPILKKYGLPATFYVITSNIDSLKKRIILDNLTQDFEIGSHTVNHTDLIKVPYTDAQKEIIESKSFLQQNFGLNSGLTIAYPWGDYNNSVKEIASDNYLAARAADIGYNSMVYLNKYALKVQGFDQNTDVSNADKWIDFAIKNHVWLVEMLHGVDNSGYSPVDSQTLSRHFFYIKQNEDLIWCSTVSDVIKYYDESNAARIYCDLCNDTVFRIRVNDYLDDSLYDQPLSIRMKVPDNWDNISVSSIGNVKTEYSDNNKFILFNVFPDNRVLRISPGNKGTTEKRSGFQIVSFSANPVMSNVDLSLEIFNSTDIDLTLISENGSILIHKREKAVSGIINFSIETSTIGKGIYFLRVEDKTDGSYTVKKFIKS
jgi:peptidoglycan/xylan/chitin deacetylase (PgdA/CDA1 family)